jgi:uncharacterized protein (TIGR01777 family)
MKILVTGATGLVGSKLIEKLIENGHQDIRVLTTNKEKAISKINLPVEIMEWNPLNNYIENNSLNDIDIIFHLAGESVADGRWSIDRKERILNSRVMGTKILLNEIKKQNKKPAKFISSSAVGIYGNTQDIAISEESPLGEGFLADVCKSWESILKNHTIENMKAHCLRTGIVLSSQGGALAKMIPPFQMGVGGRLGSGKQYMSWIHVEDLVNSFIFMMENNCNDFAYNAVSPSPLTNIDFTKVLGKVLSRPTIFPVPTLILKTIFGEMSEILLEGQKVHPNRLLKEGFKFKYNDLNSALTNILKYTTAGEVHFKRYQWVDSSLDSVFSFFSDEENLEAITPSDLQFKVTNKSTDNLEAGTLIDYKLRVHGFPFKWKTRINSFVKNDFFIDEQLKGPYTKWVHRHSFKNVKNGTLICDEVVYKVPLGALGNLVAGWFIKIDVNNIFNYRNQVIKEKF